MLTTIEGYYKKGSIELSEAPVGLQESRVLVTFLPAETPASEPKVLYGAWKEMLPANLDVEKAIEEIRDQSARRWEIDPHE